MANQKRAKRTKRIANQTYGPNFLADVMTKHMES